MPRRDDYCGCDVAPAPGEDGYRAPKRKHRVRRRPDQSALFGAAAEDGGAL